MIGWAMYFVFHIMAIFYARCKLHRLIEISDDGKSVFPAVSIIKPLTGVDCNLLSNLETFFTLKYPQYELLFCLENEDDPALMLVQSLVAKFPNVDAQIFVGGQRIGVNPKINNMMPGYQASKYDLILISDAGMRST
uniref:ceramide glucosyltransferase n=1 Tax=Romanomermis culicivorax TaxID=13658 RepID=A0A915HKJ7_ROMCU